MASTGNPAPMTGPGAPRAGRQEIADGHGPAASAQLIQAVISRLAATEIPSRVRIVRRPLGADFANRHNDWMRCHGKYGVGYSLAGSRSAGFASVGRLRLWSAHKVLSNGK